MNRHSFFFAALLLILAVAVSAHAQVMQSDNYEIQSDSINFGGGHSTSSSYLLEDTIGEIGTGESSSENYALSAGYQSMQQVYLAMSEPADVVMATLGGLTGGIANGSTTVTVTTDGAAGYQLFIRASDAPAMQLGVLSIADYAPAGAAPDFAFSVGTDEAQFGFTPEGSDVASRFLDDGGTCNTGLTDTPFACWDGLSTTDAVIADRPSANHPNGTETVIHFRVGIGATAHVIAGTYIATTTITAIAL